MENEDREDREDVSREIEEIKTVPLLSTNTFHVVINSVQTLYANACRHTGDYVELSQEYADLPVVKPRGAENSVVFVYQFVERINGLVDYDAVQAEFPGMTYSQINGVFDFLRCISQFNTANVDIDEVEQMYSADDAELIRSLREAVQEGAGGHVRVAG